MLAGVALVAPPAFAADQPSGFYYGSDGYQPTPSGQYPYNEPFIGGVLGFYGAEVTTWTDIFGCTQGRAYNSRAAADANLNASQLQWTPSPMGTSLYYYAAKPGADPYYNGSTSEAYGWGVYQANKAMAVYNQYGPAVFTPILFMDVEYPIHKYNGWNHVVHTAPGPGNCGQQISIGISPALDRATFNGFWNTVNSSGYLVPGVYSSPSFWNHTFVQGSAYASISNTWQWTSEANTARLSSPTTPVGVKPNTDARAGLEMLVVSGSLYG